MVGRKEIEPVVQWGRREAAWMAERMDLWKADLLGSGLVVDWAVSKG